MHSDDVAAALADPTTLAMLKGMRFMRVDDDEIQAVAQAIADAHQRKPGADASGRLDDARTIIAAIDALVYHRAHDASDASKKASKGSQDASRHVQDASSKVDDASSKSSDASQPVQDASHDASQVAGHVIPMAGKKRSKKSDPSA